LKAEGEAFYFSITVSSLEKAAHYCAEQEGVFLDSNSVTPWAELCIRRLAESFARKDALGSEGPFPCGYPRMDFCQATWQAVLLLMRAQVLHFRAAHPLHPLLPEHLLLLKVFELASQADVSFVATRNAGDERKAQGWAETAPRVALFEEERSNLESAHKDSWTAADQATAAVEEARAATAQAAAATRAATRAATASEALVGLHNLAQTSASRAARLRGPWTSP